MVSVKPAFVQPELNNRLDVRTLSTFHYRMHALLCTQVHGVEHRVAVDKIEGRRGPSRFSSRPNVNYRINRIVYGFLIYSQFRP